MNPHLMNMFRRAWMQNPLDTENDLMALARKFPSNRYGDVLTELRAEQPMSHAQRLRVSGAGRVKEEQVYGVHGLH